MELKICTYNSSEEDRFISDSVDLIVRALPDGKGRVALSGGSSPRSVYAALPPLPNAEFFQVDERYVPINHNESNHKLIAETIKPEKFHFFHTSLPLEDALNTYENSLPKEPFDLVVLGIGPDGHTASLFPHSPALDEKRAVASTTTDDFPVHDRLTLTFAPILAAKCVLVLLKGKEKEVVLKELTSGRKTVEEFPAKKLLEHGNLHINLFIPGRW